MLKLFIFILFNLILFVGYSQNNITVRLEVNRGGNVEFIFNNSNDFSDGIVYTNWSELLIHFNDTVTGGTGNTSTNGWILQVEAFEDKIYSVFNNGSLDLDILRFSTEYNNGTSGTNVMTDVQLDETQPVTIATWISGDPVVDISENIFITYKIKETYSASTLLSSKPRGYYTVELLFTLKEGL